MIHEAERAFFDRVHEMLSSTQLDEQARHAGLQSGIGRLSYLDDETLRRIVDGMKIPMRGRVLDLGCGNGFLARWFSWREMPVDYVGVDQSLRGIGEARTIAAGMFLQGDLRTYRSTRPFDAVFAIELVKDGELDQELVATIGAALRSGGKAVITLLSLDGGIGDAGMRGLHRLRDSGFDAKFELLTESLRDSAEHLASETIAELAERSDEYAALACEEARAVGLAIREGRFGYGAFTATKR